MGMVGLVGMMESDGVWEWARKEVRGRAEGHERVRLCVMGNRRLSEGDGERWGKKGKEKG